MAPMEFEPLQEEVVEFVRKSEVAVVDLGRKWADAVNEFLPVEMPLVQDLTKELLDFVDEVLRIQREFAVRMLEETRKVVRAQATPMTRPARATRTTKKTTHHKAA